MSERFDHFAAAREWLAQAERPDIALDETTAFADIAKVQATLALVEQQRIANLIALAQGGRGSVIGLEEIALDALRCLHVSSDGPWGNQTVELRPEVREALGLRE